MGGIWHVRTGRGATYQLLPMPSHSSARSRLSLSDRDATYSVSENGMAFNVRGAPEGAVDALEPDLSSRILFASGWEAADPENRSVSVACLFTAVFGAAASLDALFFPGAATGGVLGAGGWTAGAVSAVVLSRAPPSVDWELVGASRSSR